VVVDIDQLRAPVALERGEDAAVGRGQHLVERVAEIVVRHAGANPRSADGIAKGSRG
jgi:phenylpyruvate tautomerase PptA (4-oxalocrotonate tautomerase family)